MSSHKTFFGHPRGLATLFFTEMWERFSYYGMRALLLLFMIASVDKGGMDMDEKSAGAIYGLYTMSVYLLALPGGWIADKLLGLRKSVFYGGCMITIGHFCLAFPFKITFFLGLLFIVSGTGLLKPNISSLVGALYSKDEPAKRDAGFSIFYMGINLGATIAPFITGYLGQKINWHYGFAAAGIGMALGVIQFKLTEESLGDAGIRQLQEGTVQDLQGSDNKIRMGLLVLSLLFALLFFSVNAGWVVIDPVLIARASAYLMVGTLVLYFVYLFIFEKLTADEKNKMGVIGIFFFASALFYFGYEQQGSSLTLFADNYSLNFIGSFEFPSAWFQSVPAVSVIIFSPLFAWLWVWLAKRKSDPSTPVKFSLGLIFMGLGYAVMMGASLIVVSGTKPLPYWLIATYVFHTFGEICLYPVGLSTVTKLAPQRIVGQMMGVWFMSLALGNLVGGLYAGEFNKTAIEANPHVLIDLFGFVVKMMMLGAVVVLLLTKPIRKLMGDIK